MASEESVFLSDSGIMEQKRSLFITVLMSFWEPENLIKGRVSRRGIAPYFALEEVAETISGIKYGGRNKTTLVVV